MLAGRRDSTIHRLLNAAFALLAASDASVQDEGDVRNSCAFGCKVASGNDPRIVCTLSRSINFPRLELGMKRKEIQASFFARCLDFLCSRRPYNMLWSTDIAYCEILEFQ